MVANILNLISLFLKIQKKTWQQPVTVSPSPTDSCLFWRHDRHHHHHHHYHRRSPPPLPGFLITLPFTPSFCVSNTFDVKCCQWFSFLFQSGNSRMYILTAKIYIYTGILKLIVYMSSRHGMTQCKQKVEIIRKIVSPVFFPFEYFVIFLKNLWN